MKEEDLEIIYSKDNEAIEKDKSKCVSCGYCEMNNINLIRIKYTKINEIDKILEDIF